MGPNGSNQDTDAGFPTVSNSIMSTRDCAAGMSSLLIGVGSKPGSSRENTSVGLQHSSATFCLMILTSRTCIGTDRPGGRSVDPGKQLNAPQSESSLFLSKRAIY